MTIEEFKEINISNIKRDPDQPRKYFDKQKLEKLSQSISSNGLIQPIVVRKVHNESNNYIIVAGERRFKAMEMLGKKNILAIVKEENHPEIALIENIQREDLSPIEEALAYKNMADKYNRTQEEIAKIVGKSRSTISHIMKLNALPEKIKNYCLKNSISKRILLEIAREDTEKDMEEKFNRVIELNLTSEDLRKKRSQRSPNKPIEIQFNRKITDLTKTVKRLSKVVLTSEQKIEIKSKLNDLNESVSELLKSR